MNAVYEMYNNDKHSLTPMPSAKFGPNWSFLAWIDMSDFLFGFSDPRFYGVVLQSATPTTGFDYAIAIRGTEGALEWVDDAMGLLERNLFVQ